MAKKKTNLYAKLEHESKAKFKNTSIGRRPSPSMQNKSKRRMTKKYRGQGR